MCDTPSHRVHHPLELVQEIHVPLTYEVKAVHLPSVGFVGDFSFVVLFGFFVLWSKDGEIGTEGCCPQRQFVTPRSTCQKYPVQAMEAHGSPEPRSFGLD